jgi:ElaB/YqjD/DUF883 family membrane-anchored ribosome-binding protein
MAKLDVLKGTVDVTVYVKILDSSSGLGAGLTGLAYNSSGLVCYYVRPLGSATQLNLATQTVTGAHSDGGFVEVSSSNMPGLYRLDLSDAICASGVNSVVIMLKGATNMVQVELEIELTTFDMYSANPSVNSTQFAGQTITAAAGVTLPSSIASPTNITAGIITTVTNLTNLPAITSNWLTAAGIAASALNGKGDWNIGKTGYALSTGGVQAIWDALTSALTTVGSIGKLLVDNINATISSRLASTSYTVPDNASITSIKTQTDKLTFDSDNFVESHPMTNVTLTSVYDLAKTAAQDSDMSIVLSKTNHLTFDSDDFVYSNPTLSSTQLNNIADGILKRDWNSVTGEADRSLLNASRKLRNKVSFSGSTLSIKKEDDTTDAYTQSVTQDSDQEPFKSVG